MPKSLVISCLCRLVFSSWLQVTCLKCHQYISGGIKNWIGIPQTSVLNHRTAISFICIYLLLLSLLNKHLSYGEEERLIFCKNHCFYKHYVSPFLGWIHLLFKVIHLAWIHLLFKVLFKDTPISLKKKKENKSKQIKKQNTQKKPTTTLYAPIKQSIAIDLAVIHFCGPREVLITSTTKNKWKTWLTLFTKEAGHQ